MNSNDVTIVGVGRNFARRSGVVLNGNLKKGSFYIDLIPNTLCRNV